MVSHEDNKLTILKTGTTIVGLKTNDFVILASDQQTTMGYRADSLSTQKVHPITKNIVLAEAGNAGDSSQMIRVLKMQSSLYENERNKRIGVKALMTLTANILNANRYYPYMIGFIIGGFVTSPELYSIDAVGGASEQKTFTTSGSGGDYAMGVLENKYKEKMSKSEAITLVCEAIRSSKKRDIYTGGLQIDIYIIDKNGIENIKKE